MEFAISTDPNASTAAAAAPQRYSEGLQLLFDESQNLTRGWMVDFAPLNCSYLNWTEGMNVSNCTGEVFEGRVFPLLNETVQLITLIFLAVAFVLGLCGNTLVIYVVARFSKMQTVTNLYILNLAVADILFVVGIPFLMATTVMEFWPFGFVMCKLFMITTSLNQFTSSLFLTIMSADRYIAVCHAISAPKFRTPMISKLVSLTAWMISALMIIPVFMYSNILNDHNDQASCNIYWPDAVGVNGHTVFTLYSFILAFGCPFAFIFIFYTLVILKLKSLGRKSKSKKRKNHRKVTKLVLTVITVYVLCWLPYWVLQLILTFSMPRQVQSRVMIIFFLVSSSLSYINSAINPILYAFLSENFKKSFLKACTCAAQKDVNNALAAENSMFPRRRGGSTKPPATKTRDIESNDAHTHVAVREDVDMPLSAAIRRPLVPRDDAFVNGRPLTTHL
ncbi:somatostatin receptor type 5-like [Penaeus monodon]|uniref:somatostatin receptor type 5-like n=1 Tax=Penaeus monodon TaxID=6687 RepID=UPI0018A71114|nr:somatostatin receptor type 5-like [Penaeus monodon]